MAGSASGAAAGLVEVGGVQAEVADELVVADDGGVVLFDDDGDGAAGPDDTEVDAVAARVDVAAVVNDDGVGLGSWCGVRDRVTWC